MHAPPKSDDPIITADQLKDYDGFIFGIPTRFGMMASQVKAFLDSTGQRARGKGRESRGLVKH